MTQGRAASAVVRLDALRHNLETLRAKATGARVMAVVKANAYGHGIAGVTAALAATDAFAVASIDEAIVLRDAGATAPIVLLEGIFSVDELAPAAAHDCELVVHDRWQVEALSAASPARPFRVWLKVDTGMNRLGFRPADAAAARAALLAAPAVASVNLMTHMACADDPGAALNAEQLRRFEELTGDWPGERSIANSAALLTNPATHADWVRPGLALYGVSPLPGRLGPYWGLRPAMTLTAALIAVREVPAGGTVGYGGIWRAERPTRVGIVGIGYGDGYPRHARPGAPVSVNGVRCGLVGRVSMDMLAVDLTPCATAKVGDPVVLWGGDPPVEEIAGQAGTIPWTLLCGVTERVKLEYRDD